MTTSQTEARAVDTAVVEAIHALRLEQPGRAYDILVAAKDAEIAALKKEAAAFAEQVQDYSNDGHIARAARSFLDKLEGRDV